VKDPEALGVTVAPFEVVEERPDEITPHVDPAADRFVGGANVIA
jgi:hypothetical protein